MHIEQFRDYCLSLKGVEECFPFDDTVLVFKVGGKMFALTGLDNPTFKVSLKCDPERSEQLREEYESVGGAYHMNKKHWNSINFASGELNNQLLKELIDHSYDLVFQSLTQKTKQEILNR